MNHTFIASSVDANKCAKCKFTKHQHGDNAVCDACPHTGKLEAFGDLALCRDCMAKEIKIALDYQRPELQEARLAAHKQMEADTLRMSREIDNSLELSPDLFNADTVAIEELRKAIDADDSIPVDKKNLALATELKTRFDKHKQVIFQKQEEIKQEYNSQKAIHQYLNTLSNKLTMEERTKLQIENINYKPTPVTIRTPKINKPKGLSKSEIKTQVKHYANLLGEGYEFMIHTIMTSKGKSPEEAYQWIKKSLEEN